MKAEINNLINSAGKIKETIKGGKGQNVAAQSPTEAKPSVERMAESVEAGIRNSINTENRLRQQLTGRIQEMRNIQTELSKEQIAQNYFRVNRERAAENGEKPQADKEETARKIREELVNATFSGERLFSNNLLQNLSAHRELNEIGGELKRLLENSSNRINDLISELKVKQIEMQNILSLPGTILDGSSINIDDLNKQLASSAAVANLFQVSSADLQNIL